MPQKRISICTSRSVGSRRAIVVEVSPDLSLAAEYAFALYVVGCMLKLVARDGISQVIVTPRVIHFAPFRDDSRYCCLNANSADYASKRHRAYSLCIATIGSAREARHAGRRDAPIDMNASSATAAEKLNTSSGLISNKRLPSDRVRSKAPRTPTMVPIAVSTTLPCKTCEMTRPRVAPSAIRIPNSRAL